jgi:SAM-dependent methyltransferase
LDYADLLQQIEFHPTVRMEELPFKNETFDLVISQYGLEYGNPREVLTEVTRVLKPGGQAVFLILPSRGIAVLNANRNLKQCRYMLREAKLFDIAIDVAGKMAAAETATPDADSGILMAPFNIEVENVVRRFGPDECDVVLAMVLGLQKVFISRKTTPLEEQVVSIQTLRTRLAEYAARAQALTRAAVSDTGLEDLKRATAIVGMRPTSAQPVLVGRYGAIAWRLIAERPGRQ